MEVKFVRGKAREETVGKVTQPSKNENYGML
jgi:hypothetical protein